MSATASSETLGDSVATSAGVVGRPLNPTDRGSVVTPDPRVTTQVVAVLAPVVVAAVYALVRTSQKTALASLAADLFPTSPTDSGR